MSLIYCPECNGTISDKATSCPHCGFPINQDKPVDNTKYKVVNISLLKGKSVYRYTGKLVDKSIVAETLLCETLCIDNSNWLNPSEQEIDIYRRINKYPNTLISGLSLCNALYIESLFSKYCNVEVVPCETDEDNNTFVDNYREKIEAPVCCPRCGSQSISTGERGYSLLTGFLGSNKTVNRCAKCGYSWRP